MIDDGIGENWKRALTPDNRSLKHLTDKQLQSPWIIDQIMIWHGCTPDAARDAKGAEIRRRTSTTERPE
jgi:hypothetical protein